MMAQKRTAAVDATIEEGKKDDWLAPKKMKLSARKAPVVMQSNLKPVYGYETDSNICAYVVKNPKDNKYAYTWPHEKAFLNNRKLLDEAHIYDMVNLKDPNHEGNLILQRPNKMFLVRAWLKANPNDDTEEVANQLIDVLNKLSEEKEIQAGYKGGNVPRIGPF